MKQLPEEFLKRMRKLLKTEEEFQAFLSSYEKSPERGLRLNLRKMQGLSQENREKIYKTLMEDWGCVPLTGASFLEMDGKRYYRELHLSEEVLTEKGIRPGRHPYHEAGLYYMQEPSAMQVAMHLDIREGDRVADLCASPGGKSTHAADFLSMEKGGILLSNEFVGNRARTLSSNIERMGLLNAVVLNEDTSRLSARFPEYFSRVIIDAPCSGEGMFRKDDTAIAEWNPENVELCIERQKEIVENGVKMLAPGGKLAYSTCTFEEGEDEGISEYICSLDSSLLKVFEKRIFPHREQGEGHYIAVFEKAGVDSIDRSKREVELKTVKGKDRTSILPNSLPDTAGLRTLRRGCFYSHKERIREALEHGYSHTEQAKAEFPILSLPLTDSRVWTYLSGQELEAEISELSFLKGVENDFKKGSILVAVDGAVMGFGRFVQGRVKNDFPKGLRFSL